MSTLAVFLLLGGATALAASQLQKNSVGPKQLKKNAVTTAKIRNGAVTGSKVNLNSLGTVPSASHAATAGDAATLQGKAASALIQGNGEVLAARRDLGIGDDVQLLPLPGIGFVSVKCEMGTTNPASTFTVNNRSGGTMDQTLEYPEGVDSTSVPDGEGVSDGNEGLTAIRMKVATRASPATIATLDFSMVRNAPTPCGVYAQAIVSH